MGDSTTQAQQHAAEIVQLERQLREVISAARGYVAGAWSLQSLEDALETAEAHLLLNP